MANETSSNVTYQPGPVLSSTKNWMRDYRVKVYAHTTTVSASKDSSIYNQAFAKENTSDLVFDVSNLHVVFDIKRFAQYYPNSALITIYNLNASMENTFIQEGYRVVVEAGYQGNVNYGQIFDGTVIQCNRQKQEGTDYILNILALDGNQFINEGYCSFTYAKGQTARAVVQNICNKASNPIQLGYASPALDKIKLSKGIAVSGQPKKTLADIAKTINGTWYVDSGKLYMVAYSDTAEKLPGGLNQAIYLSPSTGLIGNPKQVEFGVEARCLINPKLMPYGLVNIPSQYITEQLVSIGSFSQGMTTPYKLDEKDMYRICSVEFKGDTRGNDWYADLVAVGQQGDMASMLTQGGTGN